MLNDKELARYDRQLRIDGFGRDGQEKLKAARVIIAGMGGLGSPVATYLAVAGVGHLRIVDKDVVDTSNLNRQILHWEKDIGRKKVESAREKLVQLNPWIEVEAVAETIDEHNVMALVDGCDVIIDAMDNYPTRYLLNRAAIAHKIPFIHGGISGLNGMATTLVPGKGSCLRCIFAEGPPPSTFPVLGIAAGVIGLIQATEAIKCITGVGELLVGRLLLFDGVSLTFREVKVRRRPDCQGCRHLPADC